MMTRAGFLLFLACLDVPAQALPDQWVGDREVWKLERGVLTGTSDGKSDSAWVFSGGELGDFELRFDLRVKRGTGRLQMRGVGRGPLGIGLEFGATDVRWLANGSLFVADSSAKPGEWYAYRIVCKGSEFEMFRNEVSAAYKIVAGHVAPRGTLSLILPAGARSEIEVRNIRLKE
ncbi:MAG: DUF1080 domain-containing protein [Acidobacteriota bacterium]|nr:DUF1080 domain-containing protein [Acidobacteriota bacterium]